jgi:hypothetical protein
MDRNKSYLFIINGDGYQWLDNTKIPCVPENRVNEVIAIINCGNNTAHQVKAIMQIAEKRYTCDKSYSISKDDQIFLFVSWGDNVNINSNLSLKLRYFDTFHNVYEQTFEIGELNGTILIKSYSFKNCCLNTHKIKINNKKRN